MSWQDDYREQQEKMGGPFDSPSISESVGTVFGALAVMGAKTILWIVGCVIIYWVGKAILG